ncbi:hypothetical protein TARUN_6821 [Trichoderma arundinaceum]|uniref:Uncharacterized protein n=1 Tax=Trichoderma arundinaceum TaxID=490622 RepID=A0A395NHM2_TRIAR|nr:hypothetical protein TARUN_6821 [Trichoderma arundinaceum]
MARPRDLASRYWVRRTYEHEHEQQQQPSDLCSSYSQPNEGGVTKNDGLLVGDKAEIRVSGRTQPRAALAMYAAQPDENSSPREDKDSNFVIGRRAGREGAPDRGPERGQKGLTLVSWPTPP